jgi:uncharacterized membrane protein (Fun14 family)
MAETEAIGLLSDGIATDLGIGGIAGAITGWTAKKIAKIVAFFVGIGILGLKWLEQQGVIIVNWSALRGEDGAGAAVQESATTFMESVIGTIPMGAGFAVGFALGIKKG